MPAWEGHRRIWISSEGIDAHPETPIDYVRDGEIPTTTIGIAGYKGEFFEIRLGKHGLEDGATIYVCKEGTRKISMCLEAKADMMFKFRHLRPDLEHRIDPYWTFESPRLRFGAMDHLVLLLIPRTSGGPHSTGSARIFVFKIAAPDRRTYEALASDAYLLDRFSNIYLGSSNDQQRPQPEDDTNHSPAADQRAEEKLAPVEIKYDPFQYVRTAREFTGAPLRAPASRAPPTAPTASGTKRNVHGRQKQVARATPPGSTRVEDHLTLIGRPTPSQTNFRGQNNAKVDESEDSDDDAPLGHLVDLTRFAKEKEEEESISSTSTRARRRRLIRGSPKRARSRSRSLSTSEVDFDFVSSGDESSASEPRRSPRFAKQFKLKPPHSNEKVLAVRQLLGQLDVHDEIFKDFFVHTTVQNDLAIIRKQAVPLQEQYERVRRESKVKRDVVDEGDQPKEEGDEDESSEAADKQTVDGQDFGAQVPEFIVMLIGKEAAQRIRDLGPSEVKLVCQKDVVLPIDDVAPTAGKQASKLKGRKAQKFGYFACYGNNTFEDSEFQTCWQNMIQQSAKREDELKAADDMWQKVFKKWGLNRQYEKMQHAKKAASKNRFEVYTNEERLETGRFVSV